MENEILEALIECNLIKYQEGFGYDYEGTKELIPYFIEELKSRGLLIIKL